MLRYIPHLPYVLGYAQLSTGMFTFCVLQADRAILCVLVSGADELHVLCSSFSIAI
jgi:hypothetical protein